MNLALFVILFIWIGSEVWLSTVRRAKSKGPSKDRYSLLLIWIVNNAAIALGVLAAHFLRSWQIPNRPLCMAVGIGVLVLGLALRWYSVYYLGKYFTTNVNIAADHQLIETGPYRRIRHPSYTGALLAMIGFGISLANVASLLIMVVPSFATQLWRMHVEEQALLGAFGDQYRNYMRCTKRLFPWVY